MTGIRRSIAAAAILLVSALVPLRGLLASTNARTCAPASCCMAKGKACPMHQRGGAEGSCRLRSCGEEESAVLLPWVPPAIAPVVAVQPSPASPVLPALSADDAPQHVAVAPPEPPPPRRGV